MAAIFFVFAMSLLLSSDAENVQFIGTALYLFCVIVLVFDWFEDKLIFVLSVIVGAFVGLLCFAPFLP